MKNKANEFMEQMKKVETEAKEAMAIREKASDLSRTETEKKLKIAIYEKKFDEYNSTLDKTC